MKFIIACLLLTGTGYSQAFTQTYHLEAPISGVVSDCENVLEPVALFGKVNGVVHFTYSANADPVRQQITFESHVGPHGDAKAVGLVTGNQYQMVGNTFNRIMFGVNTLESATFVNNFKIPGLYSLHYNLRVLFLMPKPGESYYESPKAFVERLEVRCK